MYLRLDKLQAVSRVVLGVVEVGLVGLDIVVVAGIDQPGNWLSSDILLHVAPEVRHYWRTQTRRYH